MKEIFVGILLFAKVFGVFALMLLGIRLKLGLASSILCGAVIMGLVFGLSASQVAVAGGQALTQEKFLFLAAIVGLILILSGAFHLFWPGRVPVVPAASITDMVSLRSRLLRKG